MGEHKFKGNTVVRKK